MTGHHLIQAVLRFCLLGLGSWLRGFQACQLVNFLAFLASEL